MKKLLIFGDSFGEEELVAYPPAHPMHLKYKKFKSFHQVIRESNIFSEVITYAEGGSDLWTQFELFKEKYTGDEEILWFETHPGRLTVDGVNYSNLSAAEFSYYEYKTGQYKNSSDASTKIELISAAIQYFKYLQRDNLDKFVNSKIISNIQKMCPTVRFIACFETSTVQAANYNLSKVAIAENIGMKIPDFYKIYESYYDIRRNHMTEVNGIILGKQIVDNYKSGLAFDINKFVLPTETDFLTYFIKRDL